MLTITAIIRTKAGTAEQLREALADVAAHVRQNEPETLGFFVSQDRADPHIFTTYERFASQAAMDRHNGSAAVAQFFGIAKPLLDGPVTLLTCQELSAKT